MKLNRLCAVTAFVVAILAAGLSASAQLKGIFTMPPDRAGMRQAIDFNPSPTIVEVVICAFDWQAQLRSGTVTNCMTFNGIVPGPKIVANVGDKVIVHFFNFLGETSSIHWHGVEIPAVMDGSHISEVGVRPYGGYRKYEFTALRAQTAWYHPHFNTSHQLEHGMHGMIVLKDPAEEQRLGLPTSEASFVFDDVLLLPDDQHAPMFPTDPAKKAERQLNGRIGNVLLMNGSDARTIQVKQGVPERWQIVNAASARFLRLSIPGHDIYRIGGDAGLVGSAVKNAPINLVSWPLWPTQRVSNPDLTRGVILSPGERAEIVWTPLGNPSTSVNVEWHDHARGLHTVAKQGNVLVLTHNHNEGTRLPIKIMQVDVQAGIANPTPWVPPATLRPVTPINYTNAAMIPVMFGHGLPTASGDVTFFAAMKNGSPLPFAKVTPADAPTVRPNDIRIFNVVNMTGADHPFHVHGFFFQPIDTQYVDMDNPQNNRTVPYPMVENKDVVIIPKRPGLVRGRSRTVMRLAVKFDDTGRQGQIFASNKVPTGTTSGGWLFHCHVLEHSARGMMSFLQVVP